MGNRVRKALKSIRSLADTDSTTFNIETTRCCREEDILRVAKIRHNLQRCERTSTCANRKLRRRASAFLAKLERGLTVLGPEPTLASSLHMRSVRLQVLTALLEAVSAYADDELRTVTVINSRWRLTPKQLRKVTAKSIKNQFRKHLERAGILDAPGFLIAFLHGEYEPTAGVFQLHFHLLTTAEKAALILERLRGRCGYQKTATGAAAIKRSKVNDRPKQFSYLLKSYWPERPVVEIDGKLKRVRGVRRIKGPRHTDYLLWLDRTDFSDIRLLNQCTFRNGKFHLSESCISRR
jgi:hypothetical protein